VTPRRADPVVSIILPVYNEGDNIASVLRHLSASMVARPRQVLVVYDFDADTTVPPVKALQAEMPEVQLQRNQLVAIYVGEAAIVQELSGGGQDEPRAGQRYLAPCRR